MMPLPPLNFFDVYRDDEYVMIGTLGMRVSVEHAMHLAAWLAAVTDADTVDDWALRILGETDPEHES